MQQVLRLSYLLLTTLISLQLSGCVEEDIVTEAAPEDMEADADAESRALKPPGGLCNTSCQCQLGTECLPKPNGAGEKVCTVILLPSPPPPSPPCAFSCQCPYGQSCYFAGLTSKYGSCKAETSKCTSACDCGIHGKCVNGTCQLVPGPFPQCGCSKNCPYNAPCVNGGCQS